MAWTRDTLRFACDVGYGLNLDAADLPMIRDLIDQNDLAAKELTELRPVAAAAKSLLNAINGWEHDRYAGRRSECYPECRRCAGDRLAEAIRAEHDRRCLSLLPYSHACNCATLKKITPAGRPRRNDA